MAQSVLIVLTLISIISCMLMFGAATVKSIIWRKTGEDATFPGAGLLYRSPAQVTKKYPLAIFPASWAMAIIWVVVLSWNMAATVYLLYRNNVASKKLFYLPERMFYLWSAAWCLTAVWCFLFDAEIHLGTFTVVFFVFIFSCLNLITACKFYHRYEANLARETASSQAMNHPYHYIVVEALSILSMWSLNALGISIGYALAYKYSFHEDEPILRGIVTPEESATMGAIFILVCFTIWWALDVAYWGKISDCIQSIYPGFAVAMLFLFLSNYKSDKGLSLPNILCLGQMILSSVAMLTRCRVKEFFLKNRFKPVMANGDRED